MFRLFSAFNKGLVYVRTLVSQISLLAALKLLRKSSPWEGWREGEVLRRLHAVAKRRRSRADGVGQFHHNPPQGLTALAPPRGLNRHFLRNSHRAPQRCASSDEAD
jgi:hypothetical protein